MLKKKQPLTNAAGEVRDLTREDFKGMRPLAEVDPGLVKAMKAFKRQVGRPKVASPKEHIGFRLAAEVIASIKATGPGYNTRVEQALQKAFVAKKAVKGRARAAGSRRPPDSASRR
jgi:uncharacterized protein (DUF4415 family)